MEGRVKVRDGAIVKTHIANLSLTIFSRYSVFFVLVSTGNEVAQSDDAMGVNHKFLFLMREVEGFDVNEVRIGGSDCFDV